jgi:predicted RNA-binding protein YlqC (UPF0109 family)
VTDDQGKMSNREHVRELLLKMVQVIVEHPKAVSIQTDYEDETIIFVVTVDRRDAGRLGLNGGRIAKSLHIIVGAMGMKFQKTIQVEIDERPRK